MAEIFLEEGNYPEAKKCLERIVTLPKPYEQDFNISAIYHNLGLSYFHLQDYKKAEDYLIKSYRLQENQKDTLRVISSSMDLANLYYEQYKDKEAISYFTHAYELSKKAPDFQLKQNAALNMAVMEENRKNYSKSLIYRKEYEQWADSLNNQNEVWGIAELEKKFAVRQKQKQVDILVGENKLKVAERNALTYASAVLLVILSTGVYLFQQKVKSNKIILMQKTELDHLNATKDKLFSIVSHDLRSSVNALKISNAKLLENLENNNYKELGRLLQNNSIIGNRAYNLLDNLLHWAVLQNKQFYFNKESIRLSNIIEQVAYNYKPFMLNKSIGFLNRVTNDVFVFADQESLKIIIRNLLDNAIKFSEDMGMISIYIRDTGQRYLELVIEDNGKGMSEAIRQELLKETALHSINNNRAGTGLGLQLCKSMISKIEGKFDIESKENTGTKIIISLLRFDQDE
ncbi:MAG TPA: tetratricopeptide repeat-containing sensor histidine kinase [Flavobacterium sp.]|nr:tetratricopeptide repeat-containing sensor histidine kinase [Flavobacterium sp.]